MQPATEDISLGILLVDFLLHLSDQDPLFAASGLENVASEIRAQCLDGFQPLRCTLFSVSFFSL